MRKVELLYILFSCGIAYSTALVVCNQQLRCYEPIKTAITYQQASIVMRSYNGVPGYLATIANGAENDFISSNVTGYLTDEAYIWLGGSNVFQNSPSTFAWSYGELQGQVFYNSSGCVTYCNWRSGQPDLAGGTQQCLCRYASGTSQWDACPCGWSAYYLMKYDNPPSAHNGVVKPSFSDMSGNVAVTISAPNLGNGADITAVSLNGVAVSRIVAQTVSSVTVIADAATTSTTGEVVVSATSRESVLGAAWTYLPGLVTATVASSPLAGGVTVTITGNAFSNGTDVVRVLLCDVPAIILGQTATSVTVRSAVSSSAALGNVVTVSVTRGSFTLVNAFTYNSAPVISTIEPDNAPLSAVTTPAVNISSKVARVDAVYPDNIGRGIYGFMAISNLTIYGSVALNSADIISARFFNADPSSVYDPEVGTATVLQASTAFVVVTVAYTSGVPRCGSWVVELTSAAVGQTSITVTVNCDPIVCRTPKPYGDGSCFRYAYSSYLRFDSAMATASSASLSTSLSVTNGANMVGFLPDASDVPFLVASVAELSRDAFWLNGRMSSQQVVAVSGPLAGQPVYDVGLQQCIAQASCNIPVLNIVPNSTQCLYSRYRAVDLQLCTDTVQFQVTRFSLPYGARVISAQPAVVAPGCNMITISGIFSGLTAISVAGVAVPIVSYNSSQAVVVTAALSAQSNLSIAVSSRFSGNNVAWNLLQVNSSAAAFPCSGSSAAVIAGAVIGAIAGICLLCVVVGLCHYCSQKRHPPPPAPVRRPSAYLPTAMSDTDIFQAIAAAVEADNARVVARLKTAHAAVFQRWCRGFGFVAVYDAISNQRHRSLPTLLAYIDVNTKGPQNPLKVAAFIQNPDAVQILVQHNASCAELDQDELEFVLQCMKGSGKFGLLLGTSSLPKWRSLTIGLRMALQWSVALKCSAAELSEAVLCCSRSTIQDQCAIFKAILADRDADVDRILALLPCIESTKTFGVANAMGLSLGQRVDAPTILSQVFRQVLTAGLSNIVVALAHVAVGCGASCDMPLLKFTKDLMAAGRETECITVITTAVRCATVCSDDDGTLLHYAVRQNRQAVVEHLLKHHATVLMTATNSRGETALHVTCDSTFAIASLLLAVRASSPVILDALDSMGQTPLFAAVLRNNLTVCRLLVQQGAAVDTTRRDGRTPLMAAVAQGNVDIAKVLLEAGADPFAFYPTGKCLFDDIQSLPSTALFEENVRKAASDRIKHIVLVSKDFALLNRIPQNQNIRKLFRQLLVELVRSCGADNDQSLLKYCRALEVDSATVCIAYVKAAITSLQPDRLRYALEFSGGCFQVVGAMYAEFVEQVEAKSVANVLFLLRLRPYWSCLLNSSGESVFVSAVTANAVTIMEAIHAMHPHLVMQPNNQGESVLHCAAKVGAFAACQWIVNHAAPLITVCDSNGNNALHACAASSATTRDRIKCAMLLKGYLDWKVPNNAGHSAFVVAKQNCDRRMCAALVPDHPLPISCPYFTACETLLESLGIGHYRDRQRDSCLCRNCVSPSRSECGHKGTDRKLYRKARGWAKFGLDAGPQGRDPALGIWDNWNGAYHGTPVETLPSIVQHGGLLQPGDRTMEGKVISELAGHLEGQPNRFTSPSILYCAQQAYAKEYMSLPAALQDSYESAQAVLQVRERPGTFNVQGETHGYTQAGRSFDAYIPNSELEWRAHHNTRGNIICTAVMIRLNEKRGAAYSPAISVAGPANAPVVAATVRLHPVVTAPSRPAPPFPASFQRPADARRR